MFLLLENRDVSAHNSAVILRTRLKIHHEKAHGTFLFSLGHYGWLHEVGEGE